MIGRGGRSTAAACAVAVDPAMIDMLCVGIRKKLKIVVLYARSVAPQTGVVR